MAAKFDFRGFVFPIGLLLLAEVAMRASGSQSDSVAPPSEILIAGAQAIADGSMLVRTYQTLAASMLGLAIGFSMGLLVGILLGLFKVLDHMLEVTIEIIRPVPSVALIPIGLLVFGLRRGFYPLEGAAKDIARRNARSLEPIPVEQVPTEIAPLVSSINELMSRLAVSFAAQRRFLADAAHELRTPVTALRLQVKLLQRSKNEIDG